MDVMGDEKDITIRKLDHLLITASTNIETGDTMLEDIVLVHQALPETDFTDVSIETKFLGKRMLAPIIITGMTGGHSLGGKINEMLAKAAEKHGIAMGVGSQRAALENPDLEETFRVARENAPSIPLIANIGAQQLLLDKGIVLAEKAIEMIEADALAIHLNPAQEVFQKGGDPYYRGVLKRIGEAVDRIRVPVIVKETGCGISAETAMKLMEAGVRIIDVSGAGGTSWILVEGERAGRNGDPSIREASRTFSGWGIPTAMSVIEVRNSFTETYIIASGGIRNGLDIAKAIAIGADYAGLALPMLRKALESAEALDNYIERIKFELKTAVFLTGSKNLSELRSTPLILSHRMLDWMSQRGIDYKEYISKRRLGNIRGRGRY